MKPILTICFSVLLFSVANAQTEKPAQNKNIKATPSSIVLVRVTQSAEKCKDQKGVTNRFRVVSETPVDILRYANLRNKWVPSQWLNQKKGDEFEDYACVPSTPFKYFSRGAGSTEAFPKP